MEEKLFERGSVTRIQINKGEAAVVQTALSMLQNDVQKVFEAELRVAGKSDGAEIIAGTTGQHPGIDRLAKAGKIDLKTISGKREAFLITSMQENGEYKIVVVGSDSQGTAYGLLEISRMIGVSPWEWWADAVPVKKDGFPVPDTTIARWPSVQYRGIFLNDEDWGLMPWSSRTFEPGLPTVGKTKGAIGPKTYARIFELLLRLRANTIWPAMHEVTVPFYFTEGNKKAADDYGIFVGTSHCEPLMRNSATEWDISGISDYNYVTNKDEMRRYWTERLKELQGARNIFTIGLRGKHDGMMQGVKTHEEHEAVLSRVIPDQRKLLETYINPNVNSIPQVFIPYKEVLDVYNDGLEVPDDVTLVWCDDNYGYIKHFPDEEERKRSGGNGIYYHVSYWGRPHDYLWLGTASPGLLYYQMKLAYDYEATKLWILNVGDIKPLEYQIELFLDMAWDIEEVVATGVVAHLGNWLEREFGGLASRELLPAMLEHYRLAYIRKPEFMGNTREEEQHPAHKVIKDLPWSEDEIIERLRAYGNLSDYVEKIETLIPDENRAAYFQLVKYPVQAAAQMNKKLLNAQLARHGKADWRQSHAAFDSIFALTHNYNILNNGKWNEMMDYKPRNLPVFQRVKERWASQPLPVYQKPRYAFSAVDFSDGSATRSPIEGLGYEGKALALQSGGSIVFHLDHLSGDSVMVEVRLLPNHPIEGDKLRFSISLDDGPAAEIGYETHGRSEEWKENVLRNQAIRRVVLPVSKHTGSRLTLKAVDEGVVIDQVLVY
ncbi:hypothetical protein C5745_07455 [Sphingobacterium haloxyli]|uniref:Gylcosyl hydrolase 115 C-terminal domain-containing protein n=2 Tax=Sphingobacterium haloxyli TaxID=2100533 RepID=A0A2S9J5C3_9SPHI|nr:hypothetical protein C5745_07455 [Sphingobacterium haloxyli]